MKKDHLWILAPGLQNIPFSSLDQSWIKQHFSEDHKIEKGKLSLIYRINSRAGPIVVNQFVKKLLREFKRPRTLVEAVIRIAESQSIEPLSILHETEEVVKKLVAAEVLVRVPKKNNINLLPITPQFKRGHTFHNYRIIENIHITTETEIYKIRDIRNRKIYALKIMRRTNSLSEASIIKKMLKQEFKILSALNGTATCKLIKTGLYHTRPYGILEWINGVPISQFASTLRYKEPYDSHNKNKLLDLAVKCIQSLSTIHERGYLHGDVHPGNFMVEQSDRVRILDLGLAQNMGPKAKIRKINGGVIPFLSPESASAMISGQQGNQITLVSEIYYLGAVLYYLFTGEYALNLSPIREDALFGVLHKPILSFQEVGARSWPSVELVLRKALQKNPSKRFSSLQEFLSTLKACSIPTSNTKPKTSFNSNSKFRKPFLQMVVRKYLTELHDLSYMKLELNQEPPHASLAFGGAGIAYALLRAAKYFNDPDLLAQADLWIGHSLAASNKPTAFEAPEFGLTHQDINPGSLYYGKVGIHFVRDLIANAMDDMTGQRNAINNFKSLIIESRNITPELLLGKAGQLIGIIHLRTVLNDNSLDELGQRIYSDLLKESWANIPFYGFAHGLGGICFSLLEWSRISGSLLPDSFWFKLRHFANIGEQSGNAIRWPIRNDEPVKSYMCSWCNGTPGLTLLWEKAYELSGEQYFSKVARSCGNEILLNGKGISHLCCGDGGRSYALLALSRLEQRKSWYDHAIKLALDTLREERLEHWENSLFKGRAGLLCLALDLLGQSTPRFPCVEVSSD